MKQLLTGCIAAISLLVIGASCVQQLPDTAATSDLKVSILPTVDGYTKATDTAFELGDQISVFLAHLTDYDNPWVNNAKFTYTQSGWKAENEILWYEDQTKKSVVVAFYPYLPDINLNGNNFTFTVQSDQSTHEKYTASDLMCGFSQEVYPTAEPIQVPFVHLLSKVVVNITNQTSRTIGDVYLGNVYGKLNFETGKLEGSKAAIKTARISRSDSTSTSAKTFQVIIPPQKTNPTLKITTHEGRIYEYTLPDEVEFRSGTERKANIVITEDSISVNFDTEIENWSPDADLNFSQGEQPDGKEWKSLGWGSYIDAFLTPFGVDFPEEWPVEIEQNINDPDYYRLVNPFTNEYSPYSGYASDRYDHYLYIRLGDYYYGNGRQAYFEHSELGLTIGQYENICGGNICPENGFQDYNYYGYIASPEYSGGYNNTIGENTFSFVSETSHQYIEINGSAYQTKAFRSVVTFPGKEREKFYGTSWDYNRGDGNTEIFVLHTDFDVPAGIKYNLFEGTLNSVTTRQLALQMLDGQVQSNVLDNGGGFDIYTLVLPIEKTGEYTLVFTYPTGDDGSSYYYFQQFTFVLDGEEIPQMQINSVQASLDPTAPDCAIDVVTQSEKPTRIGINIVPASQVSEFLPLTPEKKDGLREFIANQSSFRYLGLAGSSISEQGTVTRFLPELEPETEYAVLCYAMNAYGSDDVAITTITTERSQPDLWKALPEKGQYFDNTVNFINVNMTDVNGAEVTIEQYGDLPRYRVKAPYQQYWDEGGCSTIYNSLPQEDKDIEFWEKTFNYNGTPIEGIYYRPFSNGMWVEGDEAEAPRYLIHYARRSMNSHPNGSGKIMDKGYQLCGWFECIRGKTPYMGYSFDGIDEAFVITLEKGIYSRVTEETKAMSVRTPFKVSEYEPAFQWKSYLDLAERVDCSNATLIRETSRRNDMFEITTTNTIKR